MRGTRAGETNIRFAQTKKGIGLPELFYTFVVQSMYTNMNMKRQFFILMAAAAFSFGACQSGSQQSNADESDTAEMVAAPETEAIVTASLTGDDGTTLDLAFDNDAGTATAILGQDTILLKQDVTGSGIRYSNENYVYAEHQGEATLAKDGEIVFQKSK